MQPTIGQTTVLRNGNTVLEDRKRPEHGGQRQPRARPPRRESEPYRDWRTAFEADIRRGAPWAT